MPGAFDIAALPPQDRAGAIENLLAVSKTARMDIRHEVAAERITCSGAAAEVGGLVVLSAKSSPLVISRTARLTRDGFEPSLVLGMPRSRSSVVTQDGRESVVRLGDMTVLETTRPYTSVNPSGVDHHYFYVSRSRLALPDHVVRRVTATRLAGEDPFTRLVWTFFRALADDGTPLASVPGAEMLDHPGVELLRALICRQAGRADLGRESAANTLTLRVMNYVHAHLGDPDLSAAGIAQVHHVSVRHLYAVLAQAGITLGPWIRSRRLEACRQDLAGPEARRLTIAAIARRWGFFDATHFGRAFKSAYGMSPREWRHQQHGG
jgi:AraC-like DNA-binding protein